MSSSAAPLWGAHVAAATVVRLQEGTYLCITSSPIMATPIPCGLDTAYRLGKAHRRDGDAIVARSITRHTLVSDTGGEALATRVSVITLGGDVIRKFDRRRVPKFSLSRAASTAHRQELGPCLERRTTFVNGFDGDVE